MIPITVHPTQSVMDPDTADWIRTRVLVFRTNPARPGVIRAARAGGPCACAETRTCCFCKMHMHEKCFPAEYGQEQGLYGPGLTWGPRASVFLADRRCRTLCACRKCAKTVRETSDRTDPTALFDIMI